MLSLALLIVFVNPTYKALEFENGQQLENYQIHPELHDLKGKSIWSPKFDFQKGFIPRTKKKQLGDENLTLPASIWSHNIKQLFKFYNCPNICIRKS